MVEVVKDFRFHVVDAAAGLAVAVELVAAPEFAVPVAAVVVFVPVLLEALGAFLVVLAVAEPEFAIEPAVVVFAVVGLTAVAVVPVAAAVVLLAVALALLEPHSALSVLPFCPLRLAQRKQSRWIFGFGL